MPQASDSTDFSSKTAEFRDPDIEALDSIDDTELDNAIRHRLPISLPWHREKTIRLGSTLHSSRLKTTDPWEGRDSPFLLAHLYRVRPVLSREDGTVASFKSVSTSRLSETRDHLSLGFGVGIGLPFLAKATVKGNYERELFQNDDSNKASITASIRMGSVELSCQPRLTNKAIRMIKYDGGVNALEAEYGDYYVAGYRLGGDAAMLLSSSSYTSRQKEVFDIKLAVEVLCFESGETWSKNVVKSFAPGRSLKLLGYNTLEAKNWNLASTGSEQGSKELFETSTQIALSTQSLGNKLSETLGSMGLHDQQELTIAQCDELVHRGLVVELVLLPVRSLRHVVQWMVQDNVI